MLSLMFPDIEQWHDLRMIQTGGRSRLSTVMHGVLILVAVLAFPGLLRMVPLASLAAVLFVVGYKLIKPKQFVHMWHQGWMRFLPFVLTAAGVAFIDLLSGVGLGLAVAIMHILWKNYKVPFHFDPRTHKAGMPIHIQMSEDVTFLNKAGIKRTLNELPDGSHVILDASRTIDLDPDVLEDIEEFRGKAGERNIHVELIGFMDGQGRAARIGAPERSIKQAVNTAP